MLSRVRPAIALALFTFTSVTEASVIGIFATPGTTVADATVGPVNDNDTGPDNLPPDGYTARLNVFTVTNPPTVPPEVEIDLDVFALHSPFDLILTKGGGAPATEFRFRVTIRNKLNVDGQQPAAEGDEIGPIDIQFLNFNGATAVAAVGGNPYFENPQTPAATGAGYQFIGGTTPGPTGGPAVVNRTIRFGGLNGGGLAIPDDGEVEFTFSVIVPPGAALGNSFVMRFTANPEPGTMMLGSMALVGLGGVILRRRRGVNAEEPANQGTVAETAGTV